MLGKKPIEIATVALLICTALLVALYCLGCVHYSPPPYPPVGSTAAPMSTSPASNPTGYRTRRSPRSSHIVVEASAIEDVLPIPPDGGALPSQPLSLESKNKKATKP